MVLLLPNTQANSEDPTSSRVQVPLVTDEAEAVLHILGKRKRQEEIDAADWERLQKSEGYVRLKRRQESFGATDFDSRFRTFVLSDDLLDRADSLRKAFQEWKSIRMEDAGRRALAYLPDGSRIQAKIYPIIKSSTNSFVFELDSDPAIFFYLDPERTAAKFENTLAHELHHVGSASCSEPEGINKLSAEKRKVVEWLSAFGEGIAMLAAAGGPDVHPHATSEAKDWVIWERDVANFNPDLIRIEAFFQSILDGKLTEEEQHAKLFELINTDDIPQGPFYTVGWKMASIVEKMQGRDVVIAAVCDPRILLSAYNNIVKAQPQSFGSLVRWSDNFLDSIGNGESD